jgi:hypothetical protein
LVNMTDSQDSTLPPTAPTQLPQGQYVAPTGADATQASPTPQPQAQDAQSSLASLQQNQAPIPTEDASTNALIPDQPMPTAPDAPATDLPRFQRTVTSTLKGMLMGLAQGGIPGAVGGAIAPQGTQRNADQIEQSRVTALKQQDAQFRFTSAQAASMAADATLKAKKLETYDEDHQRDVFEANQKMADWFINKGYLPTTVTANDGASEMAAAKGLGTVPPVASLQVGKGSIMHFDLSQMPQNVGMDAVNQLNTQIGKQPIAQAAWQQTPQAARLQMIYNASQYWSPVASQDNLLQYKNDRARVASIPDQQLPNKLDTIKQYDRTISNMQSVLEGQHNKDEQQKISDFNAETPGVVNRAAGVADAQAAAKETYDDKPVYAITPNGDTVLTTAASATAAGMSGVRPVHQADIAKDQHDIRVLSDIQTKTNNVYAAAGALDKISVAQITGIAKYLADNPNTTVNTLANSRVMAEATPQARNYAISILSLRESAMGLQKVLTGTARTNETQLEALLSTLPGVEPNSGVVKQKLDAFAQNLSLLSRGLPKNTGVELTGFGTGSAGGTQQPPPAAGGFTALPGETPPPGTTMVVKDKAGNWHYSDGKNDLGVRQAPQQQTQPQGQPQQPTQPLSQTLKQGAQWVGRHSF